MLQNFIKTTLLVFLLVISNSCKKEKPEDVEPNQNPTEKTITLVTDNVEPGQIVLAQVSEQITLNPEAKISVNGQDVAAFDAGNNQVGFLMPVLPAGKVAVDYTNAGFAKTIDVNIKQYAAITAPQTVISNFTSGIDKCIENLEKHTNNNITALDADYVELAKYLNQTIKDNFNNLTDSEKVQIAYFFRSNTPDASNFIIDTLNTDFYGKKDDSGVDPGESLVRVGKSFVKNVVIGYPATKAGFMLAILPSPTLIDKIAATGFLTVGLVHIMDAISDAKRIGKLTGVADKLLEPFQKRAGKIIFSANQEENIFFKGAYRNLNSSDSKSPNAVISSIFSTLGTLQNGYNNVVSVANKVISWFPWKSPKIPEYKTPVGNQSATKELNLPGTRLSISKVSSPAIKIAYTQSGDHLAVKASSETITEETDFTFTVKFTDPALGIELEKQVEATLKPKTYFLLDDELKWLVPPTKFESEKARAFYLSEDKMTKATGIDYSKITFVNKSLDAKVKVELTKNSGSFSLKFTHFEPVTEYNTIEILYNNKLVQTIAAEIVPKFDSLEYYKAMVPGNWTMTYTRFYSASSVEQNNFTFNKDFTGICTGGINASGQAYSNKPGDATYRVECTVKKNGTGYYLEITLPDRGQIWLAYINGKGNLDFFNAFNM